MKLELSERFMRSYRNAPFAVKKSFDKQSLLLTNNLNHPSLHAKKYNEANDIWQARVNRSWRFYFEIDGDTYKIIDIVPHPK